MYVDLMVMDPGALEPVSHQLHVDTLDRLSETELVDGIVEAALREGAISSHERQALRSVVVHWARSSGGLPNATLDDLTAGAKPRPVKFERLKAPPDPPAPDWAAPPVRAAPVGPPDGGSPTRAASPETDTPWIPGGRD